MKLLNACPPAESWKQFLNPKEALSDSLRANAAQHLEVCPRCQATLERLCKGSGTWVDVAKRWQLGFPALSAGSGKETARETGAPSRPDRKQDTPATILYACPRCAKTLVAQQHHAGSKHQCPSCGQRIQVPRPAPKSPLEKTVLGELLPERNTVSTPAAEPQAPPVSRASAADDRAVPRVVETARPGRKSGAPPLPPPIPASRARKRGQSLARNVVYAALTVLLLGSGVGLVVWQYQSLQERKARAEKEEPDKRLEVARLKEAPDPADPRAALRQPTVRAEAERRENERQKDEANRSEAARQQALREEEQREAARQQVLREDAERRQAERRQDIEAQLAEVGDRIAELEAQLNQANNKITFAKGALVVLRIAYDDAVAKFGANSPDAIAGATLILVAVRGLDELNAERERIQSELRGARELNNQLQNGR